MIGLRVVSIYHLEKDDGISKYQDELSVLQKEIIKILSITEKGFWSDGMKLKSQNIYNL